MNRKELRKALRHVMKDIKGKDRERMIKAVHDSLVDHISVSNQQITIETAEDLGLEVFPLLLAVLPEVVTDLIQAMIVNILGNTDEESIDNADKLIKSMQKHINKAFEHNTTELWKRVQKESMEAVMRGDIVGQKVTLR